MIPSDWLRSLGGFHPAVVHFPIALPMAAAGIDLASLFGPWKAGVRRGAVPAIPWLIGLGAAGAVVAALLGWADAATMGFEPALRRVLFFHRWLGTATAVLSLAVLLLYHLPVPALVRRGGLWLLALGAAAAGHLGGILVYS